MKRSRLIITIVIGIIVTVAVLGGFFYASNKKREAKEEMVRVTAVQNVLMRDLEKNYPPTPKEVLRYFCEITKCFYNEQYTEEELDMLAVKIQELYDVELVENKTQEDYLKDLRTDIADMRNSNSTISGYEISPSTDVDYFVEREYSCARMYCTFRIKQGANTVSSMEQFVLRQDEDGHWKILGWELADS